MSVVKPNINNPTDYTDCIHKSQTTHDFKTYDELFERVMKVIPTSHSITSKQSETKSNTNCF